MFEKEAEEYLFDRLDPKAIDSVSEFSNKHIEEAVVSSFKDGAEFGYQEGLKAKINATTISDCPIKAEQGDKEEQLEYAKTIIQDLLDNSDEYARQRAMDFLEEKE